jgi:hypothetical protein
MLDDVLVGVFGGGWSFPSDIGYNLWAVSNLPFERDRQICVLTYRRWTLRKDSG